MTVVDTMARNALLASKYGNGVWGGGYEGTQCIYIVLLCWRLFASKIALCKVSLCPERKEEQQNRTLLNVFRATPTHRTYKS